MTVGVEVVDPLTGLLKFQSFLEKCEKILTQTSKGVGILVLFDVKNFCLINLSHGYTVGDFVLKEISRRMKSEVCFKCVGSRIKGDVFALFTTCGSYDVADVLIRHFFNLMERPFKISDSHSISLSFNYGVAFYPDQGKNVEELYVSALRALHYGNKVRKVNSSLYDLDLKGLEFKERLRVILKSENLVFKKEPIVNLDDLKPYAYEILTRLKVSDNEIKVIMPNEFLPVVERDLELSERFDLLVFDRVRENYSLSDSFCRLSINVCPLNVCNERFWEYVLSFPVERFTFEISEKTFSFYDVEFVLKFLKNLKKENKKLRLALDDFGVGACNVSTIDWVFDLIKFDRVIIKRATFDLAYRKLIKSMVKELKALSWVCVEGVEDEECYELSKVLGFSLGQGYYFS